MFWHSFQWVLIVFLLLILGNANIPIGYFEEEVRAFTRDVEFDYLSWTLEAAGVKLRQAARGDDKFIGEEAGRQLVREYIDVIASIQQSENLLSNLLSNPEREQLEKQIEQVRVELRSFYQKREELRPVAESVLQGQIEFVIAEAELALGGKAVPPVLFHSTPLPWALIVSPRYQIEQSANISLQTDYVLDQQILLEDAVAEALDVSTLIVPVGGIGSYPTMVAQSRNLNWMAEVIAHEWIHNYLTLRPLGMLYQRNQDLRTMNETVANIAGKELGAAMIARFYPELVPKPVAIATDKKGSEPESSAEPETVFDFRAEMHLTRQNVDELLAKGEIHEAEQYMESRRLFFWENGYPIRKLNQAYFAFYGSYADSPTGPAGEDPVGEAVRLMRDQHKSLADFVKQMALISSFEQLLDQLE